MNIVGDTICRRQTWRCVFILPGSQDEKRDHVRTKNRLLCVLVEEIYYDLSGSSFDQGQRGQPLLAKFLRASLYTV